MGRTMLFKQKEVINTTDGKKLGYVQDVEADFMSGKITAIIVPAESNIFTLGHKNDIIIPWNKVIKIGEETILVEL